MVDSWEAAESNMKMFKGLGLQKEKLIPFNPYFLKVDKFSSTLRLTLSSDKCSGPIVACESAILLKNS